MDKNKLKFWVDVCMGVAFLLVGITGIIKMPELTANFLWIFNFISFRLFSRIHDWSGVVLVILILVHLVLNWVWIKSMILCMFKKQDKCDLKKALFEKESLGRKNKNGKR